MLQDLISEIQAKFPKHHLELHIFPSGGIIDVEACDECGSVESASSSWRYRKGIRHSLDDAVADLLDQLYLKENRDERG